jgi:hypothetical protein
MEEWGVSVSSNLVLELVVVGESATLGGGEGGGSVPAVCSGDVDPEDVADDSNVRSEGVGTVVFSPAGNTVELGVSLSKASGRIEVSYGNPLVDLVADWDPSIVLEDGGIVVSSNG